MIDVTEQISAVRREVGGRVLEAGQARVVTVSRSYPAELADVWDACTNPERIPRWFLPVSGQLREGGRLLGLYLHLTTRRTVDPAAVAEWSASAEGRRFLTAASDAWYTASVAFGTDPAHARVAADRTTAFYTGAPEPGTPAGQHD
ncbi:MAG TPA: hypothetical protein VKU77_05565 [Streptosporangiaceae bacterium]|nr:hypothetical protein [Streptosporangiaceae bacterium]